MGLTLGAALRLSGGPHTVGRAKVPGAIAFVGAGGKTTGIFALARELQTPVVVTSTTHFGAWQAQWADRHVIAQSPAEVGSLGPEQVTLITGPIRADQRTQSANPVLLEWLHEAAARTGRVLLIEADGSRQKPLKAPAEHEPSIPSFVDLVVVVAGLGGLEKPLSAEFVHRPEAFSTISGLQVGDAVTNDALVRVLSDPSGGLKGIPRGASRAALLNQADSPELQAAARGMVGPLLAVFDKVIIAQLQRNSAYAVYEPAAGIILAAGESSRFGRPKQLLDWHGEAFVHAVARTALAAGLAPVVVVTGANADPVEASVEDLDVQIARNSGWKEGQASSIRTGLGVCPSGLGSAMFLLADQPQVTTSVIDALVEAHAVGLDPILAPLILEEHRGNPILFDRATFPDLMALRGDVGGRGIFDKHPVRYLPWHDAGLLLDVDTAEDYRRLLQQERL